jgi:hypothetical protein
MNRSSCWLALLALAMPGAVLGQSTGGFSPPSSGAAAAGGSPVGTVLPYTVQSGSTAPISPGHTITFADRPSGRPSAAPSSTARAPSQAGPTAKQQEPEKRRVASNNDVQGFDGFSFHDDVLDKETLAKARSGPDLP